MRQVCVFYVCFFFLFALLLCICFALFCFYVFVLLCFAFIMFKTDKIFIAKIYK